MPKKCWHLNVSLFSSSKTIWRNEFVLRDEHEKHTPGSSHHPSTCARKNKHKQADSWQDCEKADRCVHTSLSSHGNFQVDFTALCWMGSGLFQIVSKLTRDLVTSTQSFRVEMLVFVSLMLYVSTFNYM